MLPRRVPFVVLIVALLGSIAVAINTPRPWQFWWDACSLALGIWIALRIAGWSFARRRKSD